ncbi:MAG TPA: type II secretion system F family protein [Gemmatimonadales bacterium]|nr:type II secretion system F family protein [Gemmatimonadales bacterium]
MLYLLAACIAASVACLVLFVIQLNPGRSSVIARGLAELEEVSHGRLDAVQRRRRQARAERLRELLEDWGERIEHGRTDSSAVRLMLIQAGFMSPRAVPIYWGARLMSLAAFGAAGLMVTPILTQRLIVPLIMALWLATFGWILPVFWVGQRVKSRQKALQRALPDALDMMVVCVEAGLGLNQAMARVAQEIAFVSPLMAEQLTLVNLEIRAGTARDEALRNLGERTGLPDVRALSTMLIQTDRFGTSVAQALRVHADTMRTKRRQRAEEAAAKTTIKLIFPLVFFVFPAMFAVILAPALIQIVRTLKGI